MKTASSTFTRKNAQKEVLTYGLILEKIAEQNRLVAESKIKKTKLVEGFSVEDWGEYENGISIEEYARKRSIAL